MLTVGTQTLVQVWSALFMKTLQGEMFDHSVNHTAPCKQLFT